RRCRRKPAPIDSRPQGHRIAHQTVRGTSGGREVSWHADFHGLALELGSGRGRALFPPTARLPADRPQPKVASKFLFSVVNEKAKPLFSNRISLDHNDRADDGVFGWDRRVLKGLSLILTGGGWKPKVAEHRSHDDLPVKANPRSFLVF